MSILKRFFSTDLPFLLTNTFNQSQVKPSKEYPKTCDVKANIVVDFYHDTHDLFGLAIETFCSSLVVNPWSLVFFKKKWAIAGLFFIIVNFSIQLTINIIQYKFCRWMHLNRGPLMSEATAQATEPHHCPRNLVC